MRFPAAIPAIGLGAGISAGIAFSPSVNFCLLCGIYCCAVAAYVMRRDRAVALSLFLGFVVAGAALGRDADAASRQQPLREMFDRHAGTDGSPLFAVVEGTLIADAVRGPAGVTLELLVDRIVLDGFRLQAPGGMLIGVGGELESGQLLQWRAGRRIALPATLRVPATYLNFGTRDQERQLAWRGIALVGSVKSSRLVAVTDQGWWFSEALASIRAAVRRAVDINVGGWSTRSAAVVSAILIGDRAGLDPGVERRLQEAGTYHVIAISGGNIAILAALCSFAFRVCRVGRPASAFFIILLLTAYAFVVGGGSSVGRATLMAAIYFAGRLRDQRTLPLNVAALAAAVLFCVNPLHLVDAGFALTFGATLGILAGMSMFAGSLPVFGRSRPAAALLVASISAEAALLPVNAFVFSRITFAGLAVNFAAIPLMTVVQIAGMAAVGLTLVAPETARWPGWIAHMAVEGLVGSARLVDVAPWLTRRLAPPSPWVIAVYYLALLAFVFTRIMPARAGRSASRIAVIFALMSGFWIIATPAWPAKRTSLLRVTFLDVGQGDAAIVQFPDGRVLSVDAGGSASATFDIGSRVISPAFWAAGVRRLDYMSISHGDIDHIGGAASVFRDFKPFEIWEGVPVPPHAPRRELRALADAAGTAWRTLQPADRVDFGGVELTVHHPPRPEWERQRVRNDDSEVIEIRHGGVSFVFTGDIGREVERTIADSFPRAALRILKVPHHGSLTSSSDEFVRALFPDVAVFSAGRGNPFGHPVPAVVERYRNIGAAIYRTDQDGAVSVETDGTTLRVKTFRGRTLTLTTKGR